MAAAQVRVLRAAEGPPVALVRPAREPDPEPPGLDRDPEPPGLDRELELPGRVPVPAQPVPAGAPTLRAPSHR